MAEADPAVAATSDADLPADAMGYDLRITRSVDWTANQGLEISAREWMEIVASDPELTSDRANGPFAVRYGESRWFDWYEGNVKK